MEPTLKSNDLFIKKMKPSKFHTLRQHFEILFRENELEKTQQLGQEYLELAKSHQQDWNYGNAIHHGNLILGRIALKKGNLSEAKSFLIKAGNSPGSPQLNSFGPNMYLAKELLEKGEKEVVLEYLKLCETFWNPNLPLNKNPEWQYLISNGEIPDFGPHLFY